MNINGQKMPVETISQMGGGGERRMVEGVNSSLIYCKNFSKYHMYLYPAQ
jgi:hypothetical protein